MREEMKKMMFAGALIVGACFLAVGIYGDEAMTVLKKAVYICLECIGIG